MLDNRQNVRELQEFLRALYFENDELLINPDGLYGAETAAAVRHFQSENNLDVTGKMDYATWEHLRRAAKAEEQ